MIGLDLLHAYVEGEQFEVQDITFLWNDRINAFEFDVFGTDVILSYNSPDHAVTVYWLGGEERKKVDFNMDLFRYVAGKLNVEIEAEVEE